MWVTRRSILWLAAAAALSASTSGYAQVETNTETNSGTLYQDEGTKFDKSNKMWSQNDACGKDSFRKFPDYTAEGALQRDAYMRDCLRKHHLPPRNNLVQQPRSGP